MKQVSPNVSMAVKWQIGTKELNMKLIQEVLENTCLSCVVWLPIKMITYLNWYSFTHSIFEI